jgi:hypothetical protein
MINGRFYFMQTESGNLIGEYSNQLSLRNTPESAELVESNGQFIGNYNSTWFERNERNPVSMQINIDFKPGSEGRIFILNWRENDIVHFRGEGFLANGILVGNYWDIELENRIR